MCILTLFVYRFASLGLLFSIPLFISLAKMGVVVMFNASVCFFMSVLSLRSLYVVCSFVCACMCVCMLLTISYGVSLLVVLFSLSKL